MILKALFTKLPLLVFFLLVTQQGVTQSKPDEKLLADLRSADVMSWRLSHVKDPYMANHRQVVPKGHILTLWKDGSYVEVLKGNRREGTFSVNRDADAIRFSCKRVNHRRMQAGPTTYAIVSYAQNKLILAAQGRHGWVEHVYLPATRP